MAGRKQTNQPRQPKLPVMKDRAWFERNVADRKARLAKPPVTRPKVERRTPDAFSR